MLQKGYKNIQDKKLIVGKDSKAKPAGAEF